MDEKTAKIEEIERFLSDKNTIKAFSRILAKEDRVELIPTKDCVKVVHIQRKPVKIS